MDTGSDRVSSPFCSESQLHLAQEGAAHSSCHHSSIGFCKGLCYWLGQRCRCCLHNPVSRLGGRQSPRWGRAMGSRWHFLPRDLPLGLQPDPAAEPLPVSLSGHSDLWRPAPRTLASRLRSPARAPAVVTGIERTENWEVCPYSSDLAPWGTGDRSVPCQCLICKNKGVTWNHLQALHGSESHLL